MISPPVYHLTFVANAKRPLDLEGADLDENQLAALFSTYTVGSKGGRAVVPARMRPCPDHGCANHGLIDCGGGRPHRIDANVVSMSGLMIDSDQGDVRVLMSRLYALGLTVYTWQTHSHTAEHPKYRLFVPFHEPLPLKSKAQWSKVFWPALTRYVGLDPARSLELDRQCCNASRLYYLPEKPAGGSQVADVRWGEALDWSKVPGIDLNADPVALQASPTYRDPPRPPGTEFVFNVGAMRDRLRAWHGSAEDRAVLQALARGDALCPPPSGRASTDRRNRYGAWRTATLWLANLAEGNETAEELLSVAHESHRAERTESPDDFTPWETVEKLLDGAMADAPEYRAQKAFQREQREGAQRIADAISNRTYTVPDAPPGATVPAVDWKDLVATRTNRDGEEVIEATADNVLPVLLHHPAWDGALRFNSFRQEVEVWGGPLLRPGEKPGRPYSADSRDDVDVCAWFARAFRYKFMPSSFPQFVTAAAQARSYHPVKQYLEECCVQGVTRPGGLDTWLFDFAGVTARDDIERRLYVAYARKTMIAAVARVFEPGCKFDVLLVLVGPQGARKSTLVREMAGGGRFFSDTVSTLESSADAAETLSSGWIIELAELDALKRSEVTTLRTTLSRQVDRYRAPYAKKAVEHPRQSIFIGTTNEPDLLRDPAGSRRFWVVEVPACIDIEGFRAALPSLWAEAVAAYRAGEALHLDPELARASEGRNAQKFEVDDLLGDVLVRALFKQPQKKDFYTTAELLELVGLDVRAHPQMLSNTMKRLGWVRGRLSTPGKPRGYHVPQGFFNPHLEIVPK